MSSASPSAKQTAKEQLVENIAHHLKVNPAIAYKGESLKDRLIAWHEVTAKLIQEFKTMGITFNKAFYKGTPLIHILLASPYLPVDDKRMTIRRLRSFIPGTDTDILDSNANTTLHYFLKNLINNPSVFFLESVADKLFLQSLFSAVPEINNKNPDGETVLDLLNDLLENGIKYDIEDELLKEKLRLKFKEILQELQALKKELISIGAKTSL